MAFELIAALALAFGIGGIALLLRKLSSGRLPKIVVPLAAAFALVAFAIWGDYSWAPRTIAAFPERLIVVDEPARSDPWRPWSYLFPVRERIVAADLGAVRPVADDPAKAEVDLYFLERRLPTRRQAIVLDCSAPTDPAPDRTAISREIRDRICASRS